MLGTLLMSHPSIDEITNSLSFHFENLAFSLEWLEYIEIEHYKDLMAKEDYNLLLSLNKVYAAWKKNEYEELIEIAAKEAERILQDGK